MCRDSQEAILLPADITTFYIHVIVKKDRCSLEISKVLMNIAAFLAYSSDPPSPQFVLINVNVINLNSFSIYSVIISHCT